MPERIRTLLALAFVGALAAFLALSPIWEMDVFWHVTVALYMAVWLAVYIMK